MITREHVEAFLEALKYNLGYEFGHRDDIDRIVDETYEEELSTDDA